MVLQDIYITEEYIYFDYIMSQDKFFNYTLN